MRERRSAAREKADRRWYWLIALTLLGAGIVFIPILYTGGAIDTFRLPKEMTFRAEAIALALAGVFAATAPHARWRDAPFSRLFARIATTAGGLLGAIPEEVKSSLEYGSFRQFCDFNIDADAVHVFETFGDISHRRRHAKKTRTAIGDDRLA